MFDTLAFLEANFTDADGVIGLVGKHWPELPQREAVRKWFARGSVPGEWSFVLLLVLEIEHGQAQSLKPYSAGNDNADIFA